MARILIIDDDPDIRAVVEQTLRAAGHEVATAPDGREGLERYRAMPADLVITDVFMPNKDGYETITQLRQEFPNSALIAMSGRPEAENLLFIAQKLGAAEILPKPFPAGALLAAVGRVLRLQSPAA